MKMIKTDYGLVPAWFAELPAAGQFFLFSAAMRREIKYMVWDSFGLVGDRAISVLHALEHSDILTAAETAVEEGLFSSIQAIEERARQYLPSMRPHYEALKAMKAMDYRDWVLAIEDAKNE